MQKTRVFLISVLMLAGVDAAAQGAQEILETARERQAERWQGVNSYSVSKRIAGQSINEYYQRYNVRHDDGRISPIFQPVSADAFNCEAGEPQPVSEQAMREQLAGKTPRAQSGEAQQAQVADNIFDDGGVSPLSSDEFIRRARLVGSEPVDGRDTWQLRVEDIDFRQQSDGNTFEFDTYDVWLDKQHYVPLRAQLTGTADSGGDTRDVTIDIGMSDYREVPGSDMYEAYQQRLIMTGMLDPEQQAQLQQAQGQLEELEQQMASMPASQRQMMENMMGDQMKMLRDMAGGGAFDMTITVEQYAPNADVDGGAGAGCSGKRATPAPIPPASVAAANTTRATASGDDVALTASVQQDLAALGYDTGNTDGIMVTATIVAISQFQAENDLPVTGEVTPQLAGMLAARTKVVADVPARDPASLQAAQQACLQEKIEAAQASNKKKRGFGRLMSAVGRTATRLGGDTLSRDIAQASRDLYDANATADDLSSAAKDLGISESDIEACRNPEG